MPASDVTFEKIFRFRLFSFLARHSVWLPQHAHNAWPFQLDRVYIVIAPHLDSGQRHTGTPAIESVCCVVRKRRGKKVLRIGGPCNMPLASLLALLQYFTDFFFFSASTFEFFFFPLNRHRDLGKARQHRPMCKKKRDQTRKMLVWVDAADAPAMAVLLLITREGGRGVFRHLDTKHEQERISSSM